FTTDIRHVAGKANTTADALSRAPVEPPAVFSLQPGDTNLVDMATLAIAQRDNPQELEITQKI
ncbi:Hypothetical protein FKW44_003955, partial [Caligus rogercresseyi]